jgi:hypothetical protein
MRVHGTSGDDVHLLETKQRLFVAGQQLEIWENPALPFGCALNDLESYCLNARWILLFNAMVLAAVALQDDEGQGVPAPARFAWAFGAAVPPDAGSAGH